jgi:hypothetical protein
MWEKLILWFKFLWDAGNNLQAHSVAIDELRDNDSQFLNVTRLLIAENNLLKEQLAHEREKRADEIEKLELRLRLQFSEELRKFSNEPRA